MRINHHSRIIVRILYSRC